MLQKTMSLQKSKCSKKKKKEKARRLDLQQYKHMARNFHSGFISTPITTELTLNGMVLWPRYNFLLSSVDLFSFRFNVNTRNTWGNNSQTAGDLDSLPPNTLLYVLWRCLLEHSYLSFIVYPVVVHIHWWSTQLVKSCRVKVIRMPVRDNSMWVIFKVLPSSMKISSWQLYACFKKNQSWDNISHARRQDITPFKPFYKLLDTPYSNFSSEQNLEFQFQLREFYFINRLNNSMEEETSFPMQWQQFEGRGKEPPSLCWKEN